MFAGLFTIFLAAFSMQDSAAAKDRMGTVEIQFHHFVGARQLITDTLYNNSFGETFSIGRFKYYITNIRLRRAKDSSEVEIKESYFLVHEDDDASKILSVLAPEGEYNGISFLLGVDSLHNVTGAQTDALDPMNGMFWTWNTGYVMVKLEGKSPVSSLPARQIEYHLAGFKGADKVNSRIWLDFSKKNMLVTAKKTAIVHVKVDINSFFSGRHSLSIKAIPACTTAGSLARQFADNYATMFSVSSVESN